MTAAMTDYEAFLRRKFDFHHDYGFDVDPADLSPCLLPHQRDIVQWAIKGGRRALFESFGLGKSVQQLEILRLIVAHLAAKGERARALIVCPLGVKQEFARDARELLGTTITFLRRSEEVSGDGLYLTNYESIRDGRLDPDLFDAVSLDEASVLRSYGSKTYQSFLGLFAGTKYRFVATATPSPNRYKELIHYAGFLGVMDTGAALTRWFRRDSTHANNLTLHPHKTVEFHVWLHSWAIFLQKPSDLCECECHVLLSTSKASGSDGSSPSNGGPAPGGVGHGIVSATAATPDSLPPTTSVTEGRVAAAASDRSTEAKGLPPTPCGKRSSADAQTPTRRTGTTTGAEGSPSATGGDPSLTSCLTWESRPPGQPSSALTTIAGTAPTIADGRPERNRRTTPGAPSPSPTTEEPNRSLSGSTSSTPITVRSTVESSPSAGHPKGHSRTWCDECRCDEGYDLPDLEVVWHELPNQPGEGGHERDGQGRLYRDAALGVSEAAREKRDTLSVRVAKAKEIVDSAPDDHFILWHDLETERAALKAAMPEVVEVFGNLDLDTREERIIGFSEGEFRLLATKPTLSGSGCNFQRFCHRQIFVGVGFKFNDFIQAVHRCHRYLQPYPVRIDVIYAESEREVVKTLRRKWAQHKELTAQMSDLIRKHGLDQTSIAKALERSLGIERVEISGEGWLLANNDCVAETRAMPECSADEIITSIPFGNQYEYVASYNDFGHTDDNEHFWAQMDFLTPELLRVLRPGRIYACHVKDRILFGNVTGAGYSTVSPFHAEALMHGLKHGFEFVGMITVVTDVVRENNQSYRLGWTEMTKDGTKMGVGSPEYVLLFRKPQSDRSRGYADVPVVKDKDDYSRARWQVDAHAFWRSNGDRPLTAEDMRGLTTGQRMKLFQEWSLANVHDHEVHVSIGEELDGKAGMGTLPATFMMLAPPSPHPDVWTDVNRMRTLNTEQSRRDLVMHTCLARDSLVLTRGGHKPIQEIAVGEHVLTHKGRWRPVMAVQNTGVRPVVTVKAQGVPGLTLTPDHKLWTRPVRDLPSARSHSRREATKAEPTWVPAVETVGSYINLKLPPTEAPSVSDPRYWWTVGRWLADGHFGGAGKRDAIISFGRHETEGLVDALGSYASTPRDNGTAMQILLRDPGHELRRTLKACGEGASGKHLPPEAFTLPFMQAYPLLAGYLSGDGHYLADRNRYTASSVSRELLLGMAFLAQRVYGAVASIYPGRPAGTCVIEGRTVTTKADWVMCFDVPDEDRKKGLPFVLDDGAWKKVRAAEPAGEVETWNLRVAEDESYTAEGCVVKNCPLQFDIVDRLIERYSNPGELVFDPFAGLGTVPLRALRAGRRGRGVELNPASFIDSVRYLKAEEMRVGTPSLFDLIDMEATEPVEMSA